MRYSLVRKRPGKPLDIDKIDYNDKEVLDSIGTGKDRRRVPAGELPA